ncbi:MAG: 2-oxo acid dehydrogenase subunit E2 [Thermoleophilia bacterium]|nr:2-oxo acid dehydrogenase subunit E2 [Thermoleophilia bacterium]
MVVASNVDVVMPQMGSSVTEGTISRWLKQVGDTVQADETIVEISTDKVDTEVPAPTAGVVLELLVAEGVTVDVGTRIAVLSTDLSAKPAAAPVAAPPAEVAAPVAAVAAAPAVAERALVTQLAATGEDRAFVSPVVARMVAEHQLDITQIDGTGRGGRVTKKDVENFLAAHASGGGYAAPMAESTAITAPAVAPVVAPPAHKAPAQAPAAPAAALPAAPAGNGEEIYTFSRVRQVTAKHMRESIETAAHVTQVWEVDLGRVTDIRNRLKPKFKNDYGVSLSFLPFIMRATVEAMAAWPWMNAEVRENDAVIKRYVNLGMAVSVDDGKGLMVPAIKNAETLNLLGLAQAVADLAVRGRSKKLTIDDLTGGTFTITNPGVFGSLYGTPILPVGQVGILDTGAIVRRPMVVEGPDGSEAIAIRPMMYLSISYDHRLIDGAYASQFMAQIRTNLQTWDEEAYGA